MDKPSQLRWGALRLNPVRRIVLLCTALGAASLTTVSAVTYYVSPSGNDTNNGTSETTPWKTISKVNASIFQGGDTLLLEGGQTFIGSMNLNRSRVRSTPLSRFTVGAYGTGKPTITSTVTGSNSYAILINGVSGIVVQDLIVRPGATSPRAGIYIRSDVTTNPAPDDITVQRCDVGGFHYAPTDFGGEIFVAGYWGSVKNIKILNNVLHGLDGPSSPDDNGFTSLGSGKNIVNLTVQGNIVYDIGGTANCFAGALGNGILANGVNGGVLQHNIVHDCGGHITTCGGAGGIWAYNSNNITIQFNEVYNIQPLSYTSGCDWAAFDLDGKTTNSVVQYNYSHDNFGPGLLAYVDGTWGPNTFRYNISENDNYGNGNGGVITIAGPTVSGLIQIYNNTIYDSTNASTNGHACIYGPYKTGTWAAGSMIKNNVFYVTKSGTVNLIYFPYLPQTNLTFDNNVYHLTVAQPRWRWGATNYTTLASYQSGTGFDTHSLTTDPQLVGPGSGGTLSWTPSLANGPQPAPSGYALKSTSPLFGAGANLGSVSPGTRDYYGNTTPNGVGSGYNIGAYGKGTSSAALAAPSNLTPTWATMLNGWFKLAWTDNSTSETGFAVQSYNGASWSTYGTVGANITTYTRTGLTMPSGPYTMRVVATSGAGNSAPSNQVTFSIPAPPAGPTGLAATPGTGSVVLSWNAVTGASNYNIIRATASGGPYSVIKYNNSSAAYTDITPIVGTTYYYKVCYNVSGVGASSYCAPVSATAY